MFKAMFGFKTTLTARLVPGDDMLPIASADLLRLGDVLANVGDYTRLCVDGEIVRVTRTSDGALVAERGQEGTQPVAETAGTCVSFAWTPQSLTDFITQGGAGAAEVVTQIKAGSDRITVETAGGVATIDRPACKEIGWQSGNRKLKQTESGQVVEDGAATALSDGEYVNATVVVRDGQIASIRSGTNIVYSGGGCCCNSGSSFSQAAGA